MLDLAEEALDQVVVPVQERTEGQHLLAIGHRLHVRPRTLLGHPGSQRVAVVGSITQQDLARTQPVQHVCRRAPIMRLAFRDLQRHGTALGIHQRVDLARQAATRATHATGSALFFSAQAGC